MSSHYSSFSDLTPDVMSLSHSNVYHIQSGFDEKTHTKVSKSASSDLQHSFSNDVINKPFSETPSESFVKNSYCHS